MSWIQLIALLALFLYLLVALFFPERFG